jgi:LysM repeat protein
MTRERLIDPVEKKGALGFDAAGAEFDSLDLTKLKVEVLPQSAARVAHPFDGYPVKKFKLMAPETKDGRQMKGKDGKVVLVPTEYNLTDWVLHNHLHKAVAQDPSNRNRKTYHSRSIKDIAKGNSAPNTVMQFSTLIKTASGDFYGALVRDPYIRCQLIFTQTREGNTIVDPAYMLLDKDQSGRLKQCFLRLMKPQQDMEKAADMITAGEEPMHIPETEYGATEL